MDFGKKRKDILSIVPGNPTGINVLDGDVNTALKIFTRRVNKYGKIKEYRSNLRYEKPSEIRRETYLDAVYRREKNS